MGLSRQKNGAGTFDHEPAFTRRFLAASYRFLGPDWLWMFAVLLVSLVAAWPAIAQPGLLNTRGGGDSPFLIQRLHQLAVALADGHFPARWMPDANYGYGYPFYNFYAPLSIYIAAAFRLIGFSFVRAIHLAQLAGFAVAGLGMFHLGRRWLGSRWAGLLAAVAYIVAPFHMVNVYVRGDSLAEFWAMAFYPLVLLAADKLMHAGKKGGKGEREKGSQSTPAPLLPSPPAFFLARPIALFALAYAGLILSHNISALIFSPFLLLYVIVRLVARKGGRQKPDESSVPSSSPLPPRSPAPLLSILGALLLAFALAAWFFIPALAEQGLAQLGPVTEGYFHYSNHFRGLDLVQAGLLFDYNPDGGVAFRLGLVQAGLAAAGAAVWFLGERTRKGGEAKGRFSFVLRRSSFVVLSALFALFMITPLSRLLWDHLPLLEFAQFPWRFLSVASFFLALLAGGIVRATERTAARAAIALTGSLILLAAGLFGLRTDHLILSDADVTAERLAQYEWFTGNIGTTVSAEYLTPESNPRPWTSAWLNADERDRVVSTGGQVTSELVSRATDVQTWRVRAVGSGAEAIFPTLYWPGWAATLDGQPANLRPLPSSGLIALTVPAGEHTVTLKLGRTPVRLAAELLSLAAVMAAVALLMIGRRQPTDERPSQTSDQAPGGMAAGANGASHTLHSKLPSYLRGLLVVAGSLLLLAFLWRDDPTDLPAGDLNWDFAQMGYLHHSLEGIDFTDGTRLYAYGYSMDTIAAGETLTITLSIAPGDAGSATLALVTPAAARPTADGVADPPALSAQTIALEGETAVFTLAIATDAPAGLYVPRLILSDARPLMPSGGTRGDLFLRPLRVIAGDGNEEGATGSELDVRATDLRMRDATTLDGRFAWQSSQPLGSRYQLSWRLQNGDGLVLSQLDTQPGYGFNPTDGWPNGEPVYDWLALHLPETLTGPPPYPLVMLLYDATTGEPLLLRRVGAIIEDNGLLAGQVIEPVFAPPPNILATDMTFGQTGQPFIQLKGYQTTQTAETLELALYWAALGDIPADFTRFVHLMDATGAVVAQIDGHPAGNSYPTGQWVEGEVVADTARFDLLNLAPGEYRVAVGFYQPVEGLPRLEAIAPDGPLSDGRAVLPETIILP